MFNKSSPAVFYTSRISLKNKIISSLKAIKCGAIFVSTRKELACQIKEQHDLQLILLEYGKKFPVSYLFRLADKNKNLRVFFIIPEYKPRIISLITLNEQFDYIIDEKNFSRVLKKKVNEELIKSRLRKKERLLSYYKNEHTRFFDEMDIGFYRASPEGKVLFLNKTGIRLLGYKSFKDVKKADSKSELCGPFTLRNSFRKALQKNGRIDNFENGWRRADGSLIIVRENAKEIRDKKGGLLYYESTFTDITDEIRTKQFFKDVESKLRLIIEVVNIGIWNWDLNASSISLSNELASMLGYKPEELSPSVESFFGMFHPDDKNRLFADLLPALSRNKPDFENIIRIFNKAGEIRWIYLKGRAIGWSGNAPLYITAVHVDITERRKHQILLEHFNDQLKKALELRTAELEETNKKLLNKISELQTAEERIKNQLSFLKTLMETAVSPVHIKGTDSRYINCNKALEEYFNTPREKFIGKTDREIFPSETAEKLEAIDRQLLKNPGEITYENNVVKPGFSQREYMATKSTFLLGNGEPGGIISYITDITEKKKLETGIQKTFEKEKELVALRSKLISTASHEFRTPLTTILSSINLIEIYRERNIDGNFQELADKIKSAVKQMVALLNDVLFIDKSDEGKLQFEPAETDIVKLCGEIISETELAFGNSACIKFNHRNDRKIVSADQKLIKLIISNLLNNAIKYSGRKKEVRLDLELNNEIVFLIKDNGIGIPEEEFSAMFEPFHRGKNASDLPGTGLGLSVVKRCVGLHNGKISFESRLNSGTTFIVKLPLRYEKNSNN